MDQFEPEIEALSLIPSDGGRFEVVASGDLLFSKLEQQRHAETGEVADLVRKYLLEGKK